MSQIKSNKIYFTTDEKLKALSLLDSIDDDTKTYMVFYFLKNHFNDFCDQIIYVDNFGKKI